MFGGKRAAGKPPTGGRGGLLGQIRLGKALKKVVRIVLITYPNPVVPGELEF